MHGPKKKYMYGFRGVGARYEARAAVQRKARSCAGASGGATWRRPTGPSCAQLTCARGRAPGEGAGPHVAQGGGLGAACFYFGIFGTVLSFIFYFEIYPMSLCVLGTEVYYAVFYSKCRRMFQGTLFCVPPRKGRVPFCVQTRQTCAVLRADSKNVHRLACNLQKVCVPFHVQTRGTCIVLRAT